MSYAHRWLAALAAALFLDAPARAQDLSWKPGSVWNFSYLQVEPGQMQRYIYLSGDWKKIQEIGKKEGYVASYHVLQVNNARSGEPDLILAIESNDSYGNAELLAQQKKVEAWLAADQRTMEAQSGDRKVMRKLMGGME